MNEQIIYVIIGALVGVACGKLLDKLPVRVDWLGWAIAFALGAYVLIGGI